MVTVSLHKLASVCIVICIVVEAVSHTTQAAISCSTVSDSLSPCQSHLTSSGPTQAAPPENCCKGVRSIKGMAQQTGEHRAVCECMKATARGISGLNYDLAAALPGKCGVSISYTFGPNTDCTKVTG